MTSGRYLKDELTALIKNILESLLLGLKLEETI